MGAKVQYDGKRKRWRAIVVRNRRRIRRDFFRKEAAHEWACKTFTNLSLGKSLEEESERRPMLFAKYIELFLAEFSHNERDPRSLAPLSKVLGTKWVHEISEGHLRDYIAMRKGQGISNKTINHEVTALRHAMYIAVENRIIPAKPAISWHSLTLPAYSRDRVLTDAEVHAIREAMTPWARDPFDFALLTGLRWGDLISITESKIDLHDAALFIEQSKNKRHLLVPLTAKAMDIVHRNWHNFARCGYLFSNKRGTRLLKLRQQWLDAVKKAKVKGATWHDLRHNAELRIMPNGSYMLNTIPLQAA